MIEISLVFYGFFFFIFIILKTASPSLCGILRQSLDENSNMKESTNKFPDKEFFLGWSINLFKK